MAEPRPQRRRKTPAASAQTPEPAAAAPEPRPRGRRAAKRGVFLAENFVPDALRARLRQRRMADPAATIHAHDDIDQTLSSMGIPIYEGTRGVAAQSELAGYLTSNRQPF